MVQVFGTLWDAPVCEDAEHVDTPIGYPCAFCPETIEISDRGLILVSGEVAHRECLLYQVLRVEDDSQTSAREKALANWRRLYVERHR